MRTLPEEHVTDIGLKRLITQAGRLKDKIAPFVVDLDALQKRIKAELLSRLTEPGDDINMVSGEYIASLSAEKQERPVSMSTKYMIIEVIGIDRFIEIATLPMGELKKEFKEPQLDELAPKQYSGGGRSFKLGKKA